MPLLGFYLISFSQDRNNDNTEALRKYSEAELFYHKSLLVNSKTAGGQVLEEKYSRAALDKYLEAEVFLKTISGRNTRFLKSRDSLHFSLSLAAAELFQYFDSLSPSLKYYKQAIALKPRLISSPDSLLFKPLLFCGQIYFSRNQFDSANFYFKKAEQILDIYKGKINESQRLYNNLGVIYYQEGNYFQAGNYFRKAAEVLDKANPSFTDFLVNYRINYAISLFKLGKYEQALNILTGLLPYKKSLNEIYNNLGLVQAKLGRFKKALDFYEKTNYDNTLAIGLDNDRANAWLALHQPDSAKKYLDLALLKQRTFNKNPSGIDHGLTLKTLGDLAASTGKFESALACYQQAIQQFYPAYKDDDPRKSPYVFAGAFSYINLFNTLIAKAETQDQLYKHTGGVDHAREELSTYQSAFILLGYIERTYDSDEARLFLERSKYAIHVKPIALAINIYRATNDKSFLERAYYFDQETKASVLVFNAQRNQLMEAASPIRLREQALKREITRLSLSVSQANRFSDSLDARIKTLEINLGRIQDTITQTLPEITTKIPSVKTLQQHLLDAKTALLSYHLDSNEVTCFVITQATFDLLQRPTGTAFMDNLRDALQQVYASGADYSSVRPWTKIAETLIPSVEIRKIERLIIIPDDELNYLPFEALPTDQGFLIENYSIQYQYSTALLATEKADFTNLKTLAFAPFTRRGFKDSAITFPQLNNSAKEIAGDGGKMFMDNLATKRNFLENISGGQIIHLATHANAADSSATHAYIAFAPWNAARPIDYLLYSSEIYTLSLPKTRLVILSACETGYGELVRGEGLMSLTRAFSYAGCQNIISSLWKADDEVTAYIAHKVHRYMEEGMSLDRSLQQSKKDFLSDKKINPRKKQPAYWANLIFIGNYHAEKNRSSKWWLLGGAALALLFIGLSLRRALISSNS